MLWKGIAERGGEIQVVRAVGVEKVRVRKVETGLRDGDPGLGGRGRWWRLRARRLGPLQVHLHRGHRRGRRNLGAGHPGILQADRQQEQQQENDAEARSETGIVVVSPDDDLNTTDPELSPALPGVCS